jgi:hypothetical protein
MIFKVYTYISWFTRSQSNDLGRGTSTREPTGVREPSATWGYDYRLPVNHHFSEIALNPLIFLRLFVNQLKISLDFFSVW